jgi:hypothetical protein
MQQTIEFLSGGAAGAFLFSIAAVAITPFGEFPATPLDPPISVDVDRNAADSFVEAGILAATQRHIEEREHWATQNAEGLEASSRHQSLRTFFDTEGICHPATDRTPARAGCLGRAAERRIALATRRIVPTTDNHDLSQRKR